MAVGPRSAQGWRTRSACRGRNAAPFFFGPDGERRSAARLREARAKAVCAGCPVRSECAAAALSRREEHGVWGGFTSHERRRLLALGWADLADQRRVRVDIAGLERRLLEAAVTADPCPPSASPPGPPPRGPR